MKTAPKRKTTPRIEDYTLNGYNPKNEKNGNETKREMSFKTMKI